MIMQAIANIGSGMKPVFAVATLSLAAGITGMAISFLFLASAHYLDVMAGAAGFIAGSILATGGLVSISVQRPVRLASERRTTATERLGALDTPLDFGRWMSYFQSNRKNRPEPDWSAPMNLSAEVVRPLVRSLEQFQLGDGGGPAYLIARNREQFLSGSEGIRPVVDHWFAEEREHSRLLGAAVARFGGHCIRSHWSFTAFCFSRKWFGIRFELTVLLLTEIVSNVYYRLLRRHTTDPALRTMCWLIIRDETGHIAFHRDRLARAASSGRPAYGKYWESSFRLLGLAAASMLWVNHAPGLRALGATTPEFYREVWRDVSGFIRCLREEVKERAEVGGLATNEFREVLANQVAVL
jgi:hypothetical protein